MGCGGAYPSSLDGLQSGGIDQFGGWYFPGVRYYDTTMVGASSGISFSDTVATSGNKKNYRQNIIAVITFY